MYLRLYEKCQIFFFCDFIEVWISSTDYEKRCDTCGQTDRETGMVNLIGAFRYCTNALNNGNLSHINPLKSSDAISFITQIYAFFPPHNTFAYSL